MFLKRARAFSVWRRVAATLIAIGVVSTTTQAADAPAAPVKFTDVTAAAGIHFTQNAGRTGKKAEGLVVVSQGKG